MESSSSRPSVSFIVLALNEQERIETTVATVLQAIGQSSISDYEVVLVDDGSTDETGKIVDRLAAEKSKIRALHNERNIGIGATFKRGAAVAKCDYVMPVAGDNAASADSIRATIENAGVADIILPYPANSDGRPLLRRGGARAFTTLMNSLFGLKIRYYNGPVIRTGLLQQLETITDGYAMFSEIVIRLIGAGHSYHQIAVWQTPTTTTHSSALKPRNLREVLRTVTTLYRELHRAKQSQPRADLAKHDAGK